MAGAIPEIMAADNSLFFCIICLLGNFMMRLYTDVQLLGEIDGSTI